MCQREKFQDVQDGVIAPFDVWLLQLVVSHSMSYHLENLSLEGLERPLSILTTFYHVKHSIIQRLQQVNSKEAVQLCCKECQNEHVAEGAWPTHVQACCQTTPHTINCEEKTCVCTQIQRLDC